MNSRTALERQWAGLIVRQPAARAILSAWLCAFQVPADRVRFEDERTLLIMRAVILHRRTSHGITCVEPAQVAEYLAEHDFSLDASEAEHFVHGLIESAPDDVDVDRLALALISAMGITLPEHEVNDYLQDPYGLRAETMKARKVRAWK